MSENVNRILAGGKALWHMVADVGGTHARFGLVQQGELKERIIDLQYVRTFKNVNFPSLAQLVQSYLHSLRESSAPEVAGLYIAVAGSVQKDRIKLTNHDWSFSRTELAAQTGIPVTVLNDFSAQAYFLDRLGADDVKWIQCPLSFQGFEQAGFACRTVVGPGTGFGAATLTAGAEVIESEPGHCSFAPINEHEADLLKVLWQRYQRISIEHVFSGPGLANLYWANAQLSGVEAEAIPPDIVKAAGNQDAPEHNLAMRTVLDFSAIAGSVCGDIALSMGSLGGFYLSGDMLEKMAAVFDQEIFIRRFLDKGPFAPWCAEIPVGRIVTANPGLLGCAAFAASRTQIS
jgi:glucokinase